MNEYESDRLDPDVRHPAEEIATHAVFTLDDGGTIVTWPESARGLYGYDPEAVLGRPLDVLFAEEDDPDRTLEGLLAAATDRPRRTERWDRHADGSVFWATLSLSPRRNGTAGGYVVVSEDTTESHQHRQLLERQNDRLKEFTDVLAHDLRNPLTVMMGAIDRARRTDGNEDLDVLEETAERMERLVTDLLRVARQGDIVTDPEPTDIERIVRLSWEGTGGASEGATLQFEGPGTVAADGDRLCELFENLFRNAVEHAGADVTVHVGPMDDGFFVADDGPGILDGTQGDIFDHGFTTRAEGSGYGLSIVRTVAGAHGWDVNVADGDSAGARFEFTGVEFLD